VPIRLRENNNISILDVDGKIDINSSDLIEMIGWLVNSGKINVIVNMENVEMVDYNGLSILAIAYKNILNHKGNIKFAHVPLAAIELLKIVKLETVFEIYEDEETAIESFHSHEVDKLTLRRKFQRLDIHLSVKYKLESNQNKPKQFEGIVLNISGAGVYIYTPYTFPINSILDMEFGIPGMSKSVHATGRVSWLADKEIQPHAFPGMGVSFAHLTSAKEKSIIDFIDKNITHRADTL